MGKKVIVFVCTSGGGLGHLTRSLAVAIKLRELCPQYEIVFVTSSNALELIRRAGFLFYYIPTREKTSKAISNAGWMSQMESFFKKIILLLKPIAVVYDAAYPYQAVIRTLEAYVTKTIWIKRECYKPGLQALDQFEQQFGRIITPKELPSDVTKDTEKKKYVSPIRYLDLDTVYDRKTVRKKYGVRRKDTFVYLQLGAGIINDTKGETADAMTAVRRKKNNKILLGEYLTEKRVWDACDNVLIEREYPISKNFMGIDMAISAAGYNSFHELLTCGVPTLFVPNVMTKIDDQRKRAMLAQEYGYGLCLGVEETMAEGVTRLFEKKEEIGEGLRLYDRSNGSSEAAEYICQYICE